MSRLRWTIPRRCCPSCPRRSTCRRCRSGTASASDRGSHGSRCRCCRRRPTRIRRRSPWGPCGGASRESARHRLLGTGSNRKWNGMEWNRIALGGEGERRDGRNAWLGPGKQHSPLRWCEGGGGEGALCQANAGSALSGTGTRNFRSRSPKKDI